MLMCMDWLLLKTNMNSGSVEGLRTGMMSMMLGRLALKNVLKEIPLTRLTTLELDWSTEFVIRSSFGS